MKVLKWGDFVAFSISIIIIVLLANAVYGSGSNGSPSVVIESTEGEWIYPLDEEILVAIPGVLGDTEIHIHDGVVDVVDSPCRDKICVHAQALTAPGDWTACLPNNVFIKVLGQEHEREALDDIGF